MNITTKCRANGVRVAGAGAVALFALFGTAWPGVAQATVAPTLRVQDVDDSDDEAQLQQNLAMQQMLQSEQQAEQQNEQAQQQFLQDEMQAQQTDQQANP